MFAPPVVFCLALWHSLINQVFMYLWIFVFASCIEYCICSPPAVCCLALCHSLIEGRPGTRWCWSADFSFVLSPHSSTSRVSACAPYFFHFVNCISQNILSVFLSFSKEHMQFIEGWNEMVVRRLFIFCLFLNVQAPTLSVQRGKKLYLGWKERNRDNVWDYI